MYTLSLVKFLGCVAAVMMLAACTESAQPTPTSEARLTDNRMPKVIVTVSLRTPTASPGASETVPTATFPVNAEETPIPSPSSSPTTYVGVFIGEPTSIGPEGEVNLPPTIAPVGVGPTSPQNAGSGPITPAAECAFPVADPFAAAYAENPNLQGLGCPIEQGRQTTLVTQRFQRGRMFWRDTREIIVLSDAGTFWRVPDTWDESLPERDPSLTPPEGAMQPIRGFGLVWRQNSAFQESIGWAQGPEFPITSLWQQFQGGMLFLGESDNIYAVPAGDTGTYYRVGS